MEKERAKLLRRKSLVWSIIFMFLYGGFALQSGAFDPFALIMLACAITFIFVHLGLLLSANQ